MSGYVTERKALSMLKVFEQAGKQVSSVTVDGKRIELKFLHEEGPDSFDEVDMRHGKT